MLVNHPPSFIFIFKLPFRLGLGPAGRGWPVSHVISSPRSARQSTVGKVKRAARVRLDWAIRQVWSAGWGGGVR